MVLKRGGRIIDDRISVVGFVGETGEVDEDEDVPDWVAVGLGESEDFMAYHALDLQAWRVLGPGDADGAYCDGRPRFLTHER